MGQLEKHCCDGINIFAYCIHVFYYIVLVLILDQPLPTHNIKYFILCLNTVHMKFSKFSSSKEPLLLNLIIRWEWVSFISALLPRKEFSSPF